MELKKVTVIERFDLGPKTYAPGPAEVPADKVAKLLEKKLIATEDATEGSPQSGSTLEAEMLGALAPHAQENEGAVETIARLASEATTAIEDASSAKNDLASVDRMLDRKDALEQFPNRIAKIGEAIRVAQRADSLQAQLETAQETTLFLQNSAETVAKEIPPLAGLERGLGESALVYLGRYATRFKEMAQSDEEIKTDGQVQAEAQIQGQVVGTVVAPVVAPTVAPVLITAEELTKITGSPKAALAILEAELNTKDKLRAATDKELEALPDLAEGRIKKLRDYLSA